MGGEGFDFGGVGGGEIAEGGLGGGVVLGAGDVGEGGGAEGGEEDVAASDGNDLCMTLYRCGRIRRVAREERDRFVFDEDRGEPFAILFGDLH